MTLSIEEIEKRVNDSYELENSVLKALLTKPLVTVRTSTYQHGPYIKQCIEGVLMQKTNFAFEFIIGEDFSTDGTREIVFEYAKKYPDIIRVFTADYNVGSKANGIRCINAARGKYMALCEGDDYWIDPLKLQKQVDFLEKNKDYGLVHTNHHKLKNNTIIKNIKNKIFIPQGNVREDLLRENFISTLTVCFNVEKYDSTKKMAGSNYLMGDYPRWMALALNSKIGYLGDSTAVYRYLENSASHSNNKLKQFNFIKSTFKMKFDFIDNYQFNKETIKKVNESYCKYLFKYAVLLNESNIIDEFKSFTKNKISSKIKFYKFFFMFRKVRLLRKFIIIFTNK